MSRGELILTWLFVAGGVLTIVAQLIRSALAGTLLLFHASEHGPSWATVGVAVLTAVYAGQLWRHYRPEADTRPRGDQT